MFDDIQYAGGRFIDSDHLKPYIAIWNGTNWGELGDGVSPLLPNNWINTIAVDDSGNVYTGGQFTDINGYYYVAKWTTDKTNTTPVVNQINNKYISIHPNPSDGIVNMSLPEDGQLTVYNIIGEIVKNQNVTKGISSVSIEEALPGVYVIFFKSENNSYAPLRVVKN